MFFLKDMPTGKDLRALAQRYPGMDPEATRAALLVMRAGSELSRLFEMVLSQEGLSQGRFLTLMILHRSPKTPLNPAILAEKVGVKPPTMTGLLTGLEKEGLVEREPVEGDRRQSRIRISAKGRGVLDSILPGHYRNASAVMANLSRKEHKELARLLGKAFPHLA